MTQPLYIFDLDGTLALIEHRRRFVECPREQQDWASFYAACVDDTPNRPVIALMDACLCTGDVWVFSGRSDEVRKETEAWLHKHTPLAFESAGPYPGFVGGSDVLEMRKAGDFTADDVLKRSWYEGMLDIDKQRLVCVFDDRQRVVDMWRSLGVTCLQVAPGSF